MKNLLRLVALTISPTALLAQAKEPIKDKVYELDPLKEVAKTIAGQLCGNYFMILAKPASIKGSRVVAFRAVDQEAGGRIQVKLIARDILSTSIDNTKRIPIMAYLPSAKKNSPMPFHWIVLLSREVFETARPCIPDPEK